MSAVETMTASAHSWERLRPGDVAALLAVLRPEVVLLFKSKNPTATDEVDFDAVEPHLTESARSWLLAALRTTAPQHRWLERLTEGRI